jgi:uncharacterized protein (DUF1015 family)
VRVTNAHSGPVFLTMPDNKELNEIVARTVKDNKPDNDLVDNMGVKHRNSRYRLLFI